MMVDHHVPAKTASAADATRRMRLFAREQGVEYYEVGRAGICHAFIPEQGLVLPGEVVIGADSHTCTYGAVGAFFSGMGSTDIAAAMVTGDAWMKVPHSIKIRYTGILRKWVGGKDLILYTLSKLGVEGALYASIEFCGDTLERLSMDGRFTMSNMAIEAGAKAGIHRVDETTLRYVNARAKRSFASVEADADAHYAETHEWDVSNLEPQVAVPFLPSNGRPVSTLQDIRIDQAALGSCTNGRIEDLRIGAAIVKGKRVHPDVRFVVNPATPQIYVEAIHEGLIETFVEAGAVISPPTCGPCSGAHAWLLAPKERCVATTNRNFVNRMGGEGVLRSY